jgi:transcriptional regulator with XRE-family HTH domain
VGKSLFIIQERLARGWTRDELAAKAGVAVVTIMRYENGSNTPRKDLMAKVIKTFKDHPFVADQGKVALQLQKVEMEHIPQVPSVLRQDEVSDDAMSVQEVKERLANQLGIDPSCIKITVTY